MHSAPDVTGPINLGNPGEFTMLELASRVQALSGTEVPIEFQPLPADDPARRRPDISRAKGLLGWEPKVPLEEGLVPTIDYFRKTLAPAI
jgi:UDP-glucuronate decarboxylase